VNEIKISKEALAQMRDGIKLYPNAVYAVYQNKAFDHSGFGHVQFLAIGPENSLKKAPQRQPDTPTQINWMYQHVGWVDLDEGGVVPKEMHKDLIDG